MLTLTSVLPFALVSIFIGWEILAPIYFALFIYLTAPEVFYYPSARALDIAMVTSIQWAWLATYVPVFAYTLWSPTFPNGWWTISHAALPVTSRLFRKWTAPRCKDSLGSPSLLWGAKDVPFLSNFMKLLHVTQYLELTATKFSLWNMVLEVYQNGFNSVVTVDCAKAMLLDSAIAVFCIFAYWDLRRIGASTSNFWLHVITGVLVAVAFSPATTLALLWGLREVQWSEARQRKDTVSEI